MIERLATMLGEDMRGIYPHQTEEKYPRIVEFRTEFPMTSTGKVLKRELR